MHTLDCLLLEYRVVHSWYSVFILLSHTHAVSCGFAVSSASKLKNSTAFMLIWIFSLRVLFSMSLFWPFLTHTIFQMENHIMSCCRFFSIIFTVQFRTMLIALISCVWHFVYIYSHKMQSSCFTLNWHCSGYMRSFARLMSNCVSNPFRDIVEYIHYKHLKKTSPTTSTECVRFGQPERYYWILFF